MSENEKKETTPETASTVDADANADETTERSADESTDTGGEVRAEDAAPSASEDASEGVDAESGSHASEIATQASSVEEEVEDPELAAAALKAPERPSEERPDDDSESLSSMAYHSFGVTAPGEGRRPVQADLHPDLDDDALRARGMEADHQPNAALIVMVFGLIGFMAVIFVVGMQLYYLSIEDARRDRGAAVDRTLLQVRVNSEEAVQSFGRDEETGEVKIPIADARRLLVENPQWLARHPLAPAPAVPTPVPVETAPADDPADAPDGEDASAEN